MTKTILLTGATGFVGKAIHARLAAQSRSVLPISRRPHPGYMPIGDIDGSTDWTAALGDVDTVVHLAARVHVMRDTAKDPLTAFREVNVEATRRLAAQAVDAGVRRLVFVSSIKVNGERSERRVPFTAEDPPAPVDPYGVSKFEAEQALFGIARESAMDVVVVRAPLVYGPGVRANFRAMMVWLTRGVPLPFGAVANRRTLIGVDNLVDLLVTCIDHPAAAGQVFLAGDPEDLSTTELLIRLGRALGVSPRLFPVPSWLLEFAAAAVGRQETARRLLDNLQIDSSKARQMLGWSPPISVDDGLRKAAADFLAGRR